jgi:glucose-6-phosphate isomerase
LVSTTSEWAALTSHADAIEKLHLKDLLQDPERSELLHTEHDGIFLDYSRQRVTAETLDLLESLASKQQLREKMDAMFRGDKINFTEKRAVLHTALRARLEDPRRPFVDGQDTVEEVHQVLEKVRDFSEAVR